MKEYYLRIQWTNQDVRTIYEKEDYLKTDSARVGSFDIYRIKGPERQSGNK